MNTIEITKKDIYWNYLALLLKLGSNFLILPIVLSALSINEIAIWYVFGGIFSLVILLDLGFSPSIMRNIIYARSGATKLQTNGSPIYSEIASPNINLLVNLIHSSKLIVITKVIIASILLYSFGSIYLNSLTSNLPIQYNFEWIIYSLGILMNILFSIWEPLLKGMGSVKEASQSIIISYSSYLLMSYLGVLFGFGLMSLSISFLLSALINGFFASIFFKLKFNSVHRLLSKSYDFSEIKVILKTIFPNAYKLGLVVLGSWLILRSSTLLSASFIDLNITAQYGLTLQFLGIIGSFSSLLFHSLSPDIIYSKFSNNAHRFNMLFSISFAFQWFFSFFGILTIIFLGPIALTFINSNITLLPKPLFFLLSFFLFFEWNYSTFISYIGLTNKVPFVKSTIYSGIIIFCVSYILLAVFDFGILALILTHGLVQMSFNFWYWPRFALKETNLSVFKIFKTTYFSIKKYFKITI
jgi:O-antigen/teichoic acid export membrane protein